MRWKTNPDYQKKILVKFKSREDSPLIRCNYRKNTIYIHKTIYFFIDIALGCCVGITHLSSWNHWRW